MNKSESIKELATALAKAQGEVENATKTSRNDHFKNKYADLAEVLNTIRPVFASHGLSIVQLPSYEAPIASVETVLMHSSGEYISSTCSAPVSKADAQGVGSAITYLRRYSMAAVAGIAQEDDDGNGATGAGNRDQRQQPQPAQAKPVASNAIYPQADFDKNFPAWSKLIAAGKKTHADVIAMIETKAPLTDNQKGVINAVKVTSQEPQA